MKTITVRAHTGVSVSRTRDSAAFNFAAVRTPLVCIKCNCFWAFSTTEMCKVCLERRGLSREAIGALI